MKLALKVILPIVLLLVGFGAVAITLLAGTPPPARGQAEPPAVPITVISAKREPVRFTVTSQGSVAPRIQTTIVSEVTGHIVEVSPSLESGGFFESNEILARIDPRNYETARRRAQADLARARTNVQTEQAMATQAQEDFEKFQSLTDAREATDLTLRKPQLATALAELDLAKAALRKAEEDLERTVIRAPFDGMIVQKHADLGQFVNTGTQLATSVSIDLAEIRLPLSIKDFQYLDLQHLSGENTIPVKLTAETGVDETSVWEGQIVRSEGFINETSRVVYVVAQVKRPYEPTEERPALLFGTFVTAEITGREAGELFVIPRDVVQPGQTVWVVADEDKLFPKQLSIVRSDRDFSYVQSGLIDDDKICTTPLDQPVPGMRIRLSG